MGETQRNQVNVRLTDEENETLTKASKTMRVSKSEVMRLLLNDELESATSKPRVTLNDNEQQAIMRRMSEVVNELNVTRSEVNRVGNNVNQIARTLNLGTQKGVRQELDPFEKEFVVLSSHVERLSMEVQRLWQSLV